MKRDGKPNIPTFVKWAGGKKQLLTKFENFFPERIERYFEPFVGGGAIAFFIIEKYKPKEAIISDTNKELMNAYRIIRDKVEELIKELKKLKEKHNKETYYKIRAEDPELISPLTRASRFIYLNKTCFNGLYRVNSKGKFNVPMGKYKNPAICPEEDLRKISELLNKSNVKIKCEDFEKTTKDAKKGDFIYFDPPYHPLNKTSNFTTYSKDNFLEEEQKRLYKNFAKLDKKGCKVMLSNSDTEFIKELYEDYDPEKVKATRMINSKGDKRGEINELVIRNYKKQNFV